MKHDFLSAEAYQVIHFAEQFDAGLASGFSAIAQGCKNENEYLLRCKELISDIRKYTKVFFEQSRLREANRKEALLFPVLDRIEEQIKKTMRLPQARRTRRAL